jgi:cell division protein FtsQ
MDRSHVGRLGLGSLTHGPVRKQARRPARPGKAGPRAGATSPIDAAIELLLRAPASLARLLVGCWALLERKRLRLAVLAGTIALPLIGGGWLWLRHSSLVAVQHVRVSGVHGSEAQAIEAALTGAAKRMSTLDVSTSKLRAAVAPYPVVGDVRVHTSFPHGLSIQVIEQSPVATLSAGGVKTAVAANGVVLGEAHASSSLPTLSSQVQLSPGEHVRETTLLGELTVLGAAPKGLTKSVQRAYSSSKGLTLVMHSGLRAYFGDSSRPHAKWTALVRVLADPGSVGASYVDVRVPERPAAGFPAGVTPPAVAGAEGETAASSASGESEQSLAEKLSAAVGGSSTSQQTGNAEEEASSNGAGASTSEAESSPTGEGEAQASGETGAATSPESSG